MCQCDIIKPDSVLYHMDKGNKMIPYHKNCGEDLTKEQEEELSKS